MTPTGSEHWLLRLGPEAWLAAARNELLAAEANERSRRKSITHARRAAGMALNAVLVAAHRSGQPAEVVEAAWGRSYIDHLRRLARPETESFGCAEPIRGACAGLVAVPVVPAQGLVALTRPAAGPSAQALAHARTVVSLAAAAVEPG